MKRKTYELQHRIKGGWMSFPENVNNPTVLSEKKKKYLVDNYGHYYRLLIHETTTTVYKSPK